MKKIGVGYQDGELRFYRVVRQGKPYDPACAMDKGKCLSFIEWLKENVKEEDLPHDYTVYGFLNRYRHDRREDRIRYLRAIGTCEDPEAAYIKTARIAGRCCAPRALREYFDPPLCFKEDLYEYLLGMTEEPFAAFWTGVVSSGGYKAAARRMKKGCTLWAVLPELDAWARTVYLLPDRAVLAHLFAREYGAFEREYEKKSIRVKRTTGKTPENKNEGVDL